VFTRVADHAFGEDDVRELEALAQRAAPAIENARRFREARQLADLHALTGLHNRRFFHETDALYRAKDAGKGRVVAANSPGLGSA
jgi:GAF domain-containing protein